MVSLTAHGAKFTPDAENLKIEAGDLVTWNCPQREAVAFAITGDADFFQSTRLVTECGYSHAFGRAGEYEWVDAYGTGPRGVVRVHDPECRTQDDFAGWREQLAKGALVMISDGKVEPAEVDIFTGQTVFFAVVTGPGVSITDKGALAAGLADDPLGRGPLDKS